MPAAPKAVRPPAVAANIPKSWIPPVTARPWRWIVIHHSDTEVGGLAAIDKMHKAKGWDGVGYDFVIGNGTDTADGTVEPTFRWREQIIGAHAKTPDNRFNEYGIGICLVGNMMDHPPTARQLASVEKLTAFLMATYHIAPDHIMGHGDTKQTLCPGRYTNLAPHPHRRRPPGRRRDRLRQQLRPPHRRNACHGQRHQVIRQKYATAKRREGNAKRVRRCGSDTDADRCHTLQLVEPLEARGLKPRGCDVGRPIVWRSASLRVP